MIQIININYLTFIRLFIIKFVGKKFEIPSFFPQNICLNY